MSYTHERRPALQAALAAVSLLLLCASAHAAETWPAKPVRMVVAYTPGGPVDIIARPVAQRLSEAFGQSVVIDNRPGANGNIGAELVAKSAPDGYTLLMGTKSQLTVNPLLYSRMGFDPVRDLVPISLIASSASGLMVHPQLPVTTLKELTALARSRPEKLSSHVVSLSAPNRASAKANYHPRMVVAMKVPQIRNAHGRVRHRQLW